jgi:transcriptional regulator with XRE-family HTH domain
MACCPACHYDAGMNSSTAPSSFHAAHMPPGARAPFGEHLRHWRQHRRLSQQGLALEAEISTRHLSYVETGRAQPSREMVLRLAERLSVPLRERNALLVAAGFAPMYQARPLDHPDLAAARQAVELVLKGHEPSPALAVDRHWNLVAANAVVPLLLDGVAPWLLEPPVNVLRLSLHPEGLGPRLANPRSGVPICCTACSSRSPPRQTASCRHCMTKSQPIRSPRTRTPAAQPHRRALRIAHRSGHTELHQHHHHLRHARGRDAAGAGRRIVLPGKCRDTAGAAAAAGPAHGLKSKKPAGLASCGLLARLEGPVIWCLSA